MPALEGFSSGRCKRYSEAEAAPPARPPAAGAPAAHAERQDRPGPCPPPGPPPAGVGAIVAVRPRPPPGPPPGWRPRPGRADGATAPEHLCAALCPGDAHGDPAEGSRARGAVEAVVEYTVSYANQLAAPSEGPRRALDGVAAMSPPERRRFATRARLDAAFGSCPRSVQCWASAVRWWLRISRCVLVRDSPLPISAEDLQLASALFRVSGTFANYCGRWRTASEPLSASTAAFDDRSAKRARVGIAKRCPPVSECHTFCAARPSFQNRRSEDFGPGGNICQKGRGDAHVFRVCVSAAPTK